MPTNIGSNLDRELRVCYSVARAGESHGLLPSEIQVLQAIATGERTWTRVDDLARVGLNGSTLSGLVASNWVEEFLTEDGTAVTLSVWSAEVLSLDSDEYWEIHPGVVDQEDSSGEKTRSHIRQPQEVPRFETRPPPREPGMPRPRPKPIKLPFLFRLSRLPDDVIQGLLARTIVDPVEEAIANEECERAARGEPEFVVREARTEDGRLDVDPDTGKVRLEPVICMPDYTPHGGKIPIAKPRGRLSKKKRRKRRRSA